MAGLVGALLPLALGIAVSPVPLLALAVVLLSSPTWRPGAGFAAGWVAGIAGTLVVLSGVASSVPTPGGSSSPVSGTASLVLGAALVVLAGGLAWRLRRRHRRGVETSTGTSDAAGRWLSAVTTLTFPRAATVGLVMSLNPKSLAIGAGAALQVDGAGVGAALVTLAVVAYTLVAASTVLVPVVARVWAGDRLTERLQRGRDRLRRRGDRVTVAAVGLVGAVLVVRGLASV